MPVRKFYQFPGFISFLNILIYATCRAVMLQLMYKKSKTYILDLEYWLKEKFQNFHKIIWKSEKKN